MATLKETQPAPPRVVWADPFRALAKTLQTEAATLRDLGSDEQSADLLAKAARRVEEAVDRAAVGEWMLLEDAAPLLKLTRGGARARCSRILEALGLAEKRGGFWYVHVDALPARKSAA